MSEYLKKIIIPNLSGGEDEITILSPDDIKDQINGSDLVSVVKISQADYNRLDDYSAKTLYVIPGKRIYLGNSLVWKKPVYNDNDLAGTWDEDSVSSNWGFYSNNTFTALEDVTDVETKEFIKDLSDYSGTSNELRSGVRRLYHAPKNGGIKIVDASTLISADFSGVKFGENNNDLFGYGVSNLKYLNFTDADTSSVTNMYGMFSGCSSLESLDLSSFDTSSVTDMTHMFSGCSSLKSLDLSSFDTSSVTDMRNMFYKCSSLKSLDLSFFDTSRVTYMTSMFSGCSSLKSLDLSSFDTSSVIYTSNMFSGCSSLKSLDLSSFDTTSVTNMSSMFFGCHSLESLDLSSFDTTSVTDMSYMFIGCHSLESLDLSSFDTSRVTYMTSMFSGCNNLVDVIGPIRGIKTTLNLGDCTMLSQDSAMVFIEGLETATSSFSTITFSQNTFDSLTPEQISIATSKGWTVLRSY